MQEISLISSLNGSMLSVKSARLVANKVRSDAAYLILDFCTGKVQFPLFQQPKLDLSGPVDLGNLPRDILLRHLVAVLSVAGG
jgi:hypothetical protein